MQEGGERVTQIETLPDFAFLVMVYGGDLWWDRGFWVVVFGCGKKCHFFEIFL
jgi:hypothetical protein